MKKKMYQIRLKSYFEDGLINIAYNPEVFTQEKAKEHLDCLIGLEDFETDTNYIIEIFKQVALSAWYEAGFKDVTEKWVEDYISKLDCFPVFGADTSLECYRFDNAEQWDAYEKEDVEVKVYTGNFDNVHSWEEVEL